MLTTQLQIGHVKNVLKNEDERKAIETHGLYDLNDFMPKRPNDEELRIIMEMFEASVDGNLYDPEKFGAYYKPYGLDLGNTTAKTETTQATAQPSAPAETKSAEDSKPCSKGRSNIQPAMVEVTSTTTGGSNEADDIPAMIRSRKSD